MENFSLAGITVSVFFDTRRQKKDLFYPIKYRVTFERKRVYYYSKYDLTEDDWIKLPDTKKRELIETRKLIQAGFDSVKEHIKDMVKGEGFSFDGLTKRLSKGKKDSIISAYEKKIEDLTKTGQVGTASTYQCSINSIKKFTSKDLKFSDIGLDWVKRYESHLRSEEKSRTTIKFYIGCLRAIMNEAIGDIITEAQYPFGKGKFEIKTGTGRKMALTLSQIGAVLKYELLTDTEKKCRDLWFFSYLCNGINFSDMLRLRYKDIAGGEISFYRQKTIRSSQNLKLISVTYLPEMKEIVKKWGNPDKKPSSYLFPFLSPGMSPIDEKRVIQNVVRLCNKKMKAISDALKFDSTISSYTARHSFATVLKRSGANIAFISESLGHSDLRTTENYLSSFESEERAKNARALTNF
jgi:integrase/recombinase XerD